MLKLIPAPFLFLLLILASYCLSLSANAQNVQQFTGSNVILLGFETPEGIIEFGSDHLQVRYLKETQKVECRLPVNTLYPVNDTIPDDLANEILFGSKYPEIVFLIDAPDDIINGPKLTEEPQERRTTIEFQGTPNETRIPVVFASERGVIVLSTSFDIRMSHFRASIPARYVPLLTGRLLFKMRNARWINNPK